MACAYFRSNCRCFILLLLALIQFCSNKFVEGGISAVKKTIKSRDGDIIDCVDIYRQPAFRNPLLTNYKILLKHSSYIRGLEARNSSNELFQGWHKDRECPLGTIPILRAPKMFGPRPLAPPTPQSNGRFNTSSVSSNDVTREQAIVNLPDGHYIGARGKFNLWIPQVADAPQEYSISQMMVRSRDLSKLNLIQAGWQVVTGDNKARFFILWTRDSFVSTGCYNLRCPGFVQTNHRFVIGGVLTPISIYGGKQSEFKLAIKKDQETGAWVLQFNNEVVGFWPKSIFTDLANAATTVSFGGEVSNTAPMGYHTTTQMGSGHYAGEGYGKACYISHIGYIENDNIFEDANVLIPSVTYDSCYDLNIIHSGPLGAHIYFGGPGHSPDCP